MEQVKLNVFEKNILVMPNVFITRLVKVNDNSVSVIKTSQNGNELQYPIDTKEEFNKTADEFIKEFAIKNHEVCEEHDKENNLGNNYKIYLKK